jgi:HlyD family secretion protein
VPRRVRFAILSVVLLAIAGGVWWWLSHAAPAPIAWQGYAEADYVKAAPTQQGLLTELSVARGDRVKAGAPLFAQDDVSDRAARDQAAWLLKQAQEQLANLEAGGKTTEIQQAEANLVDAKATLVRVQTDLQRGEALLRHGDATRQAVDQLRADDQSAEAKVHGAEAALAQLLAPLGRDREIAGQRTAVDASRAALAMAEWRLAQRRVAAPADAVVADVLAQPGETMEAGAPVVSLLPPGNIFVRFFVPEASLSLVHRGERVRLICDSCAADLEATISFVSPQAEYTPPVIYSESSRAKLVYLVEARPPPDQAGRLNPGQPVEIRPAGSWAGP